MVRGRLIAIDRDNQSISVESSDGEHIATLPYDYLVLSTGLQYQLPQLGQSIPRHVFTVNDSHQEKQLMQWIRERLNKREKGSTTQTNWVDDIEFPYL